MYKKDSDKITLSGMKIILNYYNNNSIRPIWATDYKIVLISNWKLLQSIIYFAIAHII